MKIKTKSKNRKKPSALFIIFISVVLIILIGWILIVHRTNNSNVEVSKNIVDNSYNNHSLNDDTGLIQKDDKLYYTYYSGNFFDCGIYEISSKGSMRIKCSNIENLYSFLYPGHLDNIFEYNGALVLDPYPNSFNILFTINSFLGIGQKYLDLGTIDGLGISEVEVYNNELYCFAGNSVYKYNNGNYEKMIDLPEKVFNDGRRIFNYHQYCFHNNILYIPVENDKTYDIYVMALDGSSKYVYHTEISAFKSIKRFAVNDNYAVIGCDWNSSFREYYALEHNIDENDAIFKDTDTGVGGEHKIYAVELKKDGKTNIVDENGEIFNLYDDKIYSCTDGVCVIDINSKKRKQLYNGDVSNIFILDSDWIYFTNYDNNLYRVSPDGKSVKTVFIA